MQCLVYPNDLQTSEGRGEKYGQLNNWSLLSSGVVATNGFRASTKISQIFADSFLGKYMLKTPLGGAQTSIFLSLAPFKSLHNGGYYDNCKLKQHSVLASSKKLQEKLWLISRDLCKDFLQ